MSEGSVKKNQSVERAFQIIELLAENRRPMRLQDISSSLNLPASTVLRFLKNLLEIGYVIQSSDTLKYSLSLKFCRIGEAVKSQISIRDTARPYLIELSELCGEASCLAIEENMEVVYVDVVEGPDKMVQTLQRIGKRAPMYCTGVGKLLLLNHDADKYLSNTALRALTQHTLIETEAIKQELLSCSQQDMAMDDEECEIGARCIAAPIRDFTGRIVAAISVSGPTSRMTKEKIQVIKDTLRVISKKISNALGY